MYQIGLFSRICHVTVKTLRYYDEIGLLTPAYINQENGYRFYTSEQLVKFHHIASLRQLGFSITEIFAFIQEKNVSQLLEQRRSELQQQIQESSDKLSRINHYLQQIQQEKKMQYQAVVKEIPDCIVYSKRFIAPSFDSYMELIPLIGKEITQANPKLTLASPAYCFIIYHDKEFKDKNIDAEYCEAVNEFGTNTGDIVFKTIPSTTAVTVMHKGPYHTLRNAYIYLMQWMEDNGYIATDNPRESYIDGIWNKTEPEQWLTEIQFPIERS